MRIFKKEDYKGEFNLRKLERETMIKCLRLCRGKISASAVVIGMSAKSFSDKIIQHKINDKEYIN